MSVLEKIKYGRNSLDKVIFKIDYHPILLIEDSISPEFQESLRSILPVFEDQKGVEYTTKFSDGKPESEAKPVSQWLFWDTEKRFKLTVTHGFMVLEDLKYISLNPYLDRIDTAVKAFEKAYHDIVYTRIGLRYINRIQFPDGDPLDWSHFIADSLTCPISEFIGDKRELSRAMSQYVINKGEWSVLFNFGIFNREYPAKISRKEYILDYDFFSTKCKSI